MPGAIYDFRGDEASLLTLGSAQERLHVRDVQVLPEVIEINYFNGGLRTLIQMKNMHRVYKIVC